MPGPPEPLGPPGPPSQAPPTCARSQGAPRPALPDQQRPRSVHDAPRPHHDPDSGRTLPATSRRPSSPQSAGHRPQPADRRGLLPTRTGLDAHGAAPERESRTSPSRPTRQVFPIWRVLRTVTSCSWIAAHTPLRHSGPNVETTCLPCSLRSRSVTQQFPETLWKRLVVGCLSLGCRHARACSLGCRRQGVCSDGRCGTGDRRMSNQHHSDPQQAVPSYQVGDVVNGHVFTGTGWVPVAQLQAALAAAHHHPGVPEPVR